MIEWIKEGLPQTKGYWLWHEVTDPHSSGCSVVYIHELTDYRPVHQEEIEKGTQDVYLYKNDAGQKLVICWNRNEKPCFSKKDGKPTCDWAPFNFPETVRKFDLDFTPIPMKNE